MLTSTFPRWEGDDGPRFVFELCRRLACDFDVCVLAPHAPGSSSSEVISGMDVVRFRYFFEWGESLAYGGGILPNLRSNPLLYLLVPLFFLFQLAALLRLLGRHRFDVVHAHWLIPQGLVAVLAGLLSGRMPALVCTAHGSDVHGLQRGFLPALKRLVARRSDAVTAVSRAMKQRLLSLDADAEKVAVISMGVDAENVFTPSLSTERRSNALLFVGRFTAQKGVESLIRAMPRVVKGRPDTILTLVGGGPQEQFLRTLSETLSVAQHVDFRGRLANDKLPELYRTNTVLVFPSESEEGFGLVCAEALACACPVIASDQSAVRDIVCDGQTGLLFPAGDSDALADRILALMADPQLRLALGCAGREYVSRHFDWQIVADRYRELLSTMQVDARRQKVR